MHLEPNAHLASQDVVTTYVSKNIGVARGSTGGDSPPKHPRLAGQKCHNTRFWTLNASKKAFAVGAQPRAPLG